MADRVVYDCMIYLQAALRPDRVHGTFRVARSGQVALCISPEVVAEVRDVLTRPELQAKATEITPERVDAFLQDVLGFARLLNEVPDAYHLERDPKDSKYINLALAAHAQRIVTWDKDLLSLMDHATPAGREFAQRFPQIRIVDPPMFLRELEEHFG